METREITNKNIIEFARDYGYNMYLFKDYLKYQKNNKDELQGKWTYEAFVLSKVDDGNIELKDVYMGNFNLLDQYAVWMGYGSTSFIPDCVCFEKYCAHRDLYEMNPNRNIAKGKSLKKVIDRKKLDA